VAWVVSEPTLGDHEHVGQRVRRAIAIAEQLVRQSIGVQSGRGIVHHALSQAPEVLDQHDPQGGLHRPQLTDRQRLDLLVGMKLAKQRLRFEMAVGVGDHCQGHAKYSRKTGKWPLGKLGHLGVEA